MKKWMKNKYIMNNIIIISQSFQFYVIESHSINVRPTFRGEEERGGEEMRKIGRNRRWERNERGWMRAVKVIYNMYIGWGWRGVKRLYIMAWLSRQRQLPGTPSGHCGAHSWFLTEYSICNSIEKMCVTHDEFSEWYWINWFLSKEIRWFERRLLNFEKYEFINENFCINFERNITMKKNCNLLFHIDKNYYFYSIWILFII